MLRQLRYRHKLVKLRTMVVNTLHALAINAGLSLRAQLLTKGGRKQLAGLQLSLISQQQRDELVSLADELTRRIATVEQWLQAQAKSDVRVQRLQTHPGVGLLTSLCLVHTLGDLIRFPRRARWRLTWASIPWSSPPRNAKPTAASVKPARGCYVIYWWRRGRRLLKMMRT